MFNNDPGLFTILSGFGGVGLVVGFILGVSLFLLALLIPWFVWRIKVYQKKAFIELQKLNAKSDPPVR